MIHAQADNNVESEMSSDVNPEEIEAKIKAKMAEIEIGIRQGLESRVSGLKQVAPSTSTDTKSSGADSIVNKAMKKITGKKASGSTAGHKDASQKLSDLKKSDSDHKDGGANSEKDKKISAVKKLFDASKGIKVSDKGASKSSAGLSTEDIKQKISMKQEEVEKLKKANQT